MRYRLYLIISRIVTLGIPSNFRRPGNQGESSPRTSTYVPRRRQKILRFDIHNWHALPAYAQACIMEPLRTTDFRELSRRVQLYKAARPLSPNTIDSGLRRLLERQLFGPLLPRFGSVEGGKASFRGGGPGIVIGASDLYFPFAVHAVGSLGLFNCSRLIEIWHYRPKDPSRSNTSYLCTFHRV